MKSLNVGLRFLLELGLLLAYGYWGFQTHDGIGQWLLGVGTPLIVAIIWGLFFAPKSARRLRNPLRLVMEIVIFGIGVLALWMTGQSILALVFGGLVSLNIVLMTVWEQ